MAAPPFEEATHKKDLVHNLGYKPIVRAFANINSYSTWGWRQIPIYYYDREYVPDIGIIILGRKIDYEHIDDNTIRFYAPEGVEIKVTLYLEPRKDAWYG